MKVRLVQIDNKERRRGKVFMKRVKERWVNEYPEHVTASIEKLRDNALRFCKEQTITNQILVRQRYKLENECRENQRNEQQRVLSCKVDQDASQVMRNKAVEDNELVNE